MTTLDLGVCPRCEALLWRYGWEPACLLCGYVNYRKVLDNGVKSDPVFTDATTVVLRYNGTIASLEEMTARLTCRRLTQSRLEYFVGCPWCGGEMILTTQSGKRKDKSESRYKCETGHRVSLKAARDGSFGWQ